MDMNDIAGTLARIEARLDLIEAKLAYAERVRGITDHGPISALSEAIDNTSLYHSDEREKLDRRLSRVEDSLTSQGLL